MIPRLTIPCGGVASERGTADDCAGAIELELPIQGVESDSPLPQRISGFGWYVSVVSPPGAGELVFMLLCPACAQKYHPPEVLAAAAAAQRSS
jgi:hypothetical protein